MDSVLTILDSSGKRLATCDDMAPGETDSRLAWKVPADGIVSHPRRRPARRPAAVRNTPIGWTSSAATLVPDYRLRLATDAVNVERGHEARLTVTAERSGGFQRPHHAGDRGAARRRAGDGPRHRRAGLQGRDRAQGGRQGPRRHDGNDAFAARPIVGGKDRDPHGRLATDPRDPPIERVAVAVAVPTPFKFTASYDQAYTPRGSVQVRHYRLVRNGYTGPLEVRLADKQFRYKQGVNGPTVVVPAGADRFDYPLMFAPFMEILRTSRTNLMATGTITDADGTAHRVIYTTEHQDEQIVAIVSPGRLDRHVWIPPRWRPSRASRRASASRLNRDKGLAGDVRVELVCPPHIAGVTAGPLDDSAPARPPACCGSTSPTARSVPSTCR